MERRRGGGGGGGGGLGRTPPFVPVRQPEEEDRSGSARDNFHRGAPGALNFKPAAVRQHRTALNAGFKV